MKNFSIMGVSLKNPIFRGGFPKNIYWERGNCLKNKLGQFPDLRGAC